MQILWYIVIGLIVGALGRLVIPGANPMGILMTILLGVVGAVVGGLIANAIGLGGTIAFIISVAVAALLVFLVSGTRRARA